jgi:hypothetical protein
MKKLLKILFLTLAVLSGGLSARAQKDTVRVLLFDLKRFFNAGKYFEARQTAAKLRTTGKLSQEDNAEFMKYYSAVLRESLFESESDSVVREFIRKNPFYEPTEDDPVPFKKTFSNYYAYPKFSVAFSFGGVSPDVIIDTVHVIGSDKKVNPEYEESFGLSTGISLQYRPVKNFSVTTGVKYYFSQYSRTVLQTADIGIVNFDYKFVYKESGHIVAVPLYLGYSFDIGKWTPEFFLGGELNYLVKSGYECYNEINGSQKKTAAKTKIDPESKYRFNYGLFFGLRVNRNFKRVSVFGEYTSTSMLRPHNNPKYNYSDNNLVYNKLFVPDAIHIQHQGISLGIKFNFGYGVIAKYGYGY